MNDYKKNYNNEDTNIEDVVDKKNDTKIENIEEKEDDTKITNIVDKEKDNTNKTIWDFSVSVKTSTHNRIAAMPRLKQRRGPQKKEKQSLPSLQLQKAFIPGKKKLPSKVNMRDRKKIDNGAQSSSKLKTDKKKESQSLIKKIISYIFK